jgi:hypothetical protein
MNKYNFIDHPIFICGHRRSGTTLFNSLLDGHPNLLVIPGESGFFYQYYPLYDDPKYSAKQKQEQILSYCIKGIIDIVNNHKSESTHDKHLDITKLRETFIKLTQGCDLSPKTLLSSLVLAFFNISAKSSSPMAWVDKTTSAEIYAAEALDWFPNAKFIHIIRDPRDNWASLISGWEKRMQYYNDVPERLMHSMIERGRFGYELSILNLKRFGEKQYLIVKYEEMIANSDSVMRRVCDFIGISFHRNLLEPTICSVPWKGNNYSDVKFDGISSLNVNKWEERISTHDAKLIEYHFYEYIKKYNYGINFSLEERMNAAVEHYKWYNYNQPFSFKREVTQSPN